MGSEERDKDERFPILQVSGPFMKRCVCRESMGRLYIQNMPSPFPHSILGKSLHISALRRLLPFFSSASQ